MNKKREQKWELVDELPNKNYKLWLNTKNGCKSCFWNEINPNELRGYKEDENNG